MYYINFFIEFDMLQYFVQSKSPKSDVYNCNNFYVFQFADIAVACRKIDAAETVCLSCQFVLSSLDECGVC